MIAKMPPSNIEAEESVLASCLLGDPEPYSLLKPSDFYKTAHQEIFKVVKSLYHISSPVTLITVTDALRQQKTLSKVGGASYLSRIIDSVPAASSTNYYCSIIKEKASKRNMIEKCNAIMASCFNDDPIDTILDKSKSLSNNTIPAIDRKRMVDISNVYTPETMLDEYRRYVAGLKNNRFITGISEIDKRIRGVAGGETLFIIARAGAYKTALLQNLLRNYVNASAWGSVFFSLEMPVANITERYLQAFDKSSGWDIESFYAKHQREQIEALEFKFKAQLKRFFVVPTKVSISEMERYVKLIEHHHKTKIGLIGVDYMGLVNETGNEYEQVSKIARGSKDLAKLLNIPVIVLSQINRKGESGSTEVTLEMGRGSGAIEEAADFMLGLWKDGDSLICSILKNRKGRAGSKWLLELINECFLIGPNAIRYVKVKKRKVGAIDEY
jgi:replicative DNA helicase